MKQDPPQLFKLAISKEIAESIVLPGQDPESMDEPTQSSEDEDPTTLLSEKLQDENKPINGKSPGEGREQTTSEQIAGHKGNGKGKGKAKRKGKSKGKGKHNGKKHKDPPERAMGHIFIHIPKQQISVSYERKGGQGR